VNEILWMLLPIAAASGWWAAKRSAAKDSEVCADRDPAYFRGLNYLLNEQPDKAIDVFIKLLEVDSETVETHLALGNLFRRRGEVDRAIRIHQSLIARPTLDREQRGLALLELGQDYMRAGLFDRAESLFNELVEMGLHRERALTNLRDIYQQEKDWDRSLDVVRRLENLSGRSHATAIAQYYCEKAEEALASGDTEAAWSLTRQAVNADKNCFRAALIQANMERTRGDYRGAVKIYRRVLQQDPTFVPEILPSLIDSYRELNSPAELKEYLRSLYMQTRDTRVLLAYSDLLLAESGFEDALRPLEEHVRQYADLVGLERFIDLKRRSGEECDIHTLEVIQRLVTRLSEKRPVYQCTRCGFNARRLHWQCPGCKGWGTVRPVHLGGIEPE
jgi:lipopolysaccharide biosynthesis regulator YciM